MADENSPVDGNGPVDENAPADEKAPVIVSYQQLREKVGQALGQKPEEIVKATQEPAPVGLEADQPPATDEEAAQFLEDLAKAMDYLEKEEKVPGVLTSPDDRFTSLLQSHLAHKSMEEKKVEPVASGGFEAKFDEKDVLGWAKSLFTWVQKLDTYDWQTAPPVPDPLPNKLRTAVLGDWGTGLYGAPACARSIEKEEYGLLLHLGDVYYSGTQNEITERFLNLWPKNPGAINRACNSNHEMYTGGRAYFKQTLKQFKQPASYFALQNDHWLLVGLDSAYDEGKLANDQVAWLQNLLAASGDRRVVLFTHHQLFSWKETPKSQLHKQVGELLKGKKLFGWYWGHEHRCMIYDQHPAYGLHARCVGHSGYPYFTDKTDVGTLGPKGNQDTVWRRVETKNMVPGGSILEGPNPYVKGEENKYGPNGYMTLEFEDDHLNEVVHTPDGERIFERQLV